MGGFDRISTWTRPTWSVAASQVWNASPGKTSERTRLTLGHSPSSLPGTTVAACSPRVVRQESRSLRQRQDMCSPGGGSSGWHFRLFRVLARVGGGARPSHSSGSGRKAPRRHPRRRAASAPSAGSCGRQGYAFKDIDSGLERWRGHAGQVSAPRHALYDPEDTTFSGHALPGGGCLLSPPQRDSRTSPRGAEAMKRSPASRTSVRSHGCNGSATASAFGRAPEASRPPRYLDTIELPRGDRATKASRQVKSAISIGGWVYATSVTLRAGCCAYFSFGGSADTEAEPAPHMAGHGGCYDGALELGRR